MDTKALFYRSLEQATEVIAHLSSDDFERPTPDTEWNAKKLANHMLYELSWIPDMIQGRTIAEVADSYDGDLIDNNATGNWQAAAERARAAAAASDLQGSAHLSYGDTTNGDYLRQVSGDLLIHSWDLSKALHLNWQMDPEVAQIIYDGMFAARELWQGSGLFKPPVAVINDADIQTKLVALAGRDPGWQAPSVPKPRMT